MRAQVLYSADRGGVAYARLILPIVLAGVLLTIAFGLAQAATPAAPVVASVLAGVAVVVATLSIWFFVSPRFVVTTEGIATRGSVWWGVGIRTRRVAWADVDRLEIATRFPVIGAVVVVTRDGQRIVSPVTSGYRALFRGEPPADHGDGLRHPALPMRAAIDALERSRVTGRGVGNWRG